MTVLLSGLCQSLVSSSFWGLQAQQQVSSLREAAAAIQTHHGDKVGVTSAQELIGRIQTGTAKKDIVNELALERVRSVLVEVKRSMESRIAAPVFAWPLPSPGEPKTSPPPRRVLPPAAPKDTYYTVATQSMASPEKSDHSPFLAEVDPAVRGRLKNLFLAQERDVNKPEDVVAVVTHFVSEALKVIREKASEDNAGFFDIPRSVLQEVTQLHAVLTAMEALIKKDTPLRGKCSAFFAAMKVSVDVQRCLKDIERATEGPAKRWTKNHLFSRDFSSIVWFLKPAV